MAKNGTLFPDTVYYQNVCQKGRNEGSKGEPRGTKGAQNGMKKNPWNISWDQSRFLLSV